MPLDEFHAYMGRHAADPPPEETPVLNDTSLLRVALMVLGGALLLCLGGIIWLAAAEPARSIPDILVGTTTLIVGGILGILVPSKRGE
jgi:hypothetical protein